MEDINTQSLGFEYWNLNYDKLKKLGKSRLTDPDAETSSNPYDPTLFTK